ncbi:pilus assembly PilX family protein [Pseudoalteromonas ruthenica]|uniref:Pilus assembly protein PilX n=1 Tax=Pseudoalteromonas ruthenica TaxID=151081 RepID=A0A0F4Q149_9GAMM|nr:hypothetical protein [Pseudoalteromonas ruthenica]KJZ00872.1 hypothetical protein TW76_01340 [Pseudoalteromonas ruthenica]KJZ01075.1 hypothetical protein TW72_04265 [Pseudoalteromonas ruthenica]TMO85769.1 pilus assembly protein PilX [Pseudoalteromonas ruthenica]TMO92539.1 pilus assembly protein PilX [Pseudoalteromonas ruthenica]TMO99008.1 pilus assembly protein PilX [Pseudoalteromonas ruthenica]|tara:strand:- start:5337 stop:5819 length:483 start_codon:yes stop_codon:yes gene_type:complete
MVNIATQRGIVLVAALVMLLAVTGIAVTLMSSSSIDIKTTNAAQERERADHQLMGEVEAAIASEVNRGTDSRFLWTLAQFAQSNDVVSLNVTGNASTSTLTNMNPGPATLNCPRRFDYTEGVVCNIMQLDTTLNYGGKSSHDVALSSGIAQELLDINKTQ